MFLLCEGHRRGIMSFLTVLSAEHDSSMSSACVGALLSGNNANDSLAFAEEKFRFANTYIIH